MPRAMATASMYFSDSVLLSGVPGMLVTSTVMAAPISMYAAEPTDMLVLSENVASLTISKAAGATLSASKVTLELLMISRSVTPGD